MHRAPTDEVIERAQTSPIGIVLILGITLSAAVAIVVMGGAALENSQEDSRIGQAEQALTQFDSRAAQVALGDSESQSVRLGTNGGSYTVDENAGTLKIYHENWDESSDVDDEYIYGNETHGVPLGSVIYETGGTTIAYQGGGVWRKDENGGVRMVSPPEFHYRQATLTFPIVRVEGSGSVSGSASGRVSRVETARNVYPDLEEASTDQEDQYASQSDRVYDNPVQEGNMTVEIESEYCEAWRTYFQARTEGEVSECVDDTVTAQIVALGTQGEFSVSDNGELRIRGMDPGHSLQSLDFRFLDSSDQKSEFNNFDWELSGSDDEGNYLGIYLETGGIGSDYCEDNPDGEEPVRTVIYFDNASTDNYGAFVIAKDDPDPFTVACEDGTQVLEFDLLDSSRSATYRSIDGSDPFDKVDGPHDPEEFSGHGVDREPISFSPDVGDEAQLDLVVQHYFALLGDADLTIKENPGNAGLSESSSGEIEYEGGGKVVTFLHVTENRIEVELN